MEWKKIADLSIGAQEQTGKLLTFNAEQQYNSRPGKYPRTEFVVSQSSCLETGGVRHSADQMEDADQSTYWADGRKGNGVGEKFVYMSPFAQEIRTPLIYFIFIHISLYMPGQSLQYGMNMKPRI